MSEASSVRNDSHPKIPAPLVKIIKATRVNLILNHFINYMPRPVQRWAVRIGARRQLVPAETLQSKYRDALQTLSQAVGAENLGDYLEFGVYQGTSLSCMFAASQELGLKQFRLFGFDSFEGLPPNAQQEDAQVWRPGEFRSSLEYTTEYLTHKGVDWNRTILIKGWFDDTLTEGTMRKYNITKTSVIMMDCDLYSSTKTALAFCKPLIKDQVIIFFDDWFSRDLADKGLGERKAFEEFLKENPQFSAEEVSNLSYTDTSKVYKVVKQN
jgi:hypothetical protein